jgi:hypothetical protein
MKKRRLSALLAAALLCCASQEAVAAPLAPQSSAFTYQGRLGVQPRYV